MLCPSRQSRLSCVQLCSDVTNLSCLYMFPPNGGASSTEPRACLLKWCTTTYPLRIEDTMKHVCARPDMCGLLCWWPYRPFVNYVFSHRQQDMLLTTLFHQRTADAPLSGYTSLEPTSKGEKQNASHLTCIDGS